MGNFSRDPFHELRRSRDQGYIGLHVEQGVPVLDRDLNLLADLVSSSVRDILQDHLGIGLADSSDAFLVEAVGEENDFRVAAPAGGGACLVGGIQVTIAEPLRYRQQADVGALTTPDEDRRDLAYLDVWVRHVDGSTDGDLANDADVGVQTSVRLRPAWRVRVAEGAVEAPEAQPGHAHCPLALIERRRREPVIAEGSVVDLRPTGMSIPALARRLQRIEEALFGAAALRSDRVPTSPASSVAGADHPRNTEPARRYALSANGGGLHRVETTPKERSA